MIVQKENKIGELVALNFRSAQIFESYGLDFCCGGKKSISEACDKKGINSDEVINELNSRLENQKLFDLNGGKTIDFNAWELDFLIDYIINTHHVYVMDSLPNIFAHSQKVASVHGENHPELNSIADLFLNLKEELEAHLQKEEKMLFPYIKSLVKIKRENIDVQYPPFGTVSNPIKMMEHEHENAGNILSYIQQLSGNYKPPQDACTTFKVLYQELKEFEDDLHTHIHLENNILFPKAAELEKQIFSNNKEQIKENIK